MIPEVKLYLGDCLEVLPILADQSADAIIADLPYGITACKWDSPIPLEPLWEQYKRIIKPRGAVVLFGSQPFTSRLVMSNLEWFRYEWIWDKVNLFTGHLNAKKRPMRQHESILVFGDGRLTYKDQKRRGKPYKGRGGQAAGNYGRHRQQKDRGNTTGYACAATILRFKGMNGEAKFHPTQKPVALLSYLVRTYTNEGEIILDNTMGSGSTGVACVQTGRNFIGIEIEQKYFDIAQKRIAEAQAELAQPQQLSLESA